MDGVLGRHVTGLEWDNLHGVFAESKEHTRPWRRASATVSISTVRERPGQYLIFN